MKIKIPLQPISINKAYYGRHVKTQACRDYESDLWTLLPKKEMIKGVVEIRYKFHIRNHKRIDIDNCIKVTQDMLVARGYIEDDRKIYKATIEKVASAEDRMEIEILSYSVGS